MFITNQLFTNELLKDSCNYIDVIDADCGTMATHLDLTTKSTDL